MRPRGPASARDDGRRGWRRRAAGPRSYRPAAISASRGSWRPLWSGEEGGRSRGVTGRRFLSLPPCYFVFFSFPFPASGLRVPSGGRETDGGGRGGVRRVVVGEAARGAREGGAEGGGGEAASRDGSRWQCRGWGPKGGGRRWGDVGWSRLEVRQLVGKLISVTATGINFILN